MTTAAGKMSLEEFLAQPGAAYHDFYELHNGQVIEVPPPTNEHVDVQKRLETLLEQRCAAHGYGAFREFYMTLPTESRRVDVALVKLSRRAEQRHTVFFGSPELVVEVLSPSNTALDMDHLREVCFKHECLEFWVVNIELRTVTVYARDGRISLYRSGQEIPVTSFAAAPPVPVDNIFA